jgi:hypothetical protein
MKLKLLPTSLVPGNILLIYKDMFNEVVEFRAELLRPAPTWRDQEPYTFQEVKPDSKSVNAIRELWVVSVVSPSPFENGREFTRWIPKFHSEGLITIKDSFEETPLEDDEDWWDDENN